MHYVSCFALYMYPALIPQEADSSLLVLSVEGPLQDTASGPHYLWKFICSAADPSRVCYHKYFCLILCLLSFVCFCMFRSFCTWEIKLLILKTVHNYCTYLYTYMYMYTCTCTYYNVCLDVLLLKGEETCKVKPVER